MKSAISALVGNSLQSKPDLIRLALFALLGLMSIYFGFLHFDASKSVLMVKHWGYYFMLAAVVSFGTSVYLVLRVHGTELVSWYRINCRWAFWLTLIALTGYLWTSQEIGFKVMMDEINLLGTSMRLHYDNVAMNPLRGYDINGVFLPLDVGFIDKRPVLFPFLISLVHDLFGYRPENALYFNLSLIPITLAICYALGTILTNRLGGLLAMVLLACFPMFNLCCHGGGFEGLNFLLILFTFLATYLFLNRQEPVFLSLLCLSTVLLANTRYESALFVLPIALGIIIGYLRAGKVVFSFGLYLTPILLLPVPWLHRIFEQDPEASWQLVSKGATSPFGLEFVPRNVFQATTLFFDTTHQQPVSFFLSCFGVIGCVLLLIVLLHELRTPGPMRSAILALVLSGLGVVMLLVILLLYFWDFDDTVTRRLALPILLLLIFPGVLVIGELFKKEFALRIAIALSLLVLLTEVAPRNAKDMFTQEYIPGQITKWQREFMERHKDEYNLVIDRPGLWVTHQVPAISIVEAGQQKGLLKFHLKYKTFDNLYAFEFYTKDIRQGVIRGDADTFLDDDYVTELVEEKTFNGVVLMRVLRVTDIKANIPEGMVEEPEPLEIKDLNRDQVLYFQKIQQARLSEVLPK